MRLAPGTCCLSGTRRGPPIYGSATASTVASPDGLRATLTVRGVYSDRALLPGLAMPIQAFDQLFHQDRLQQMFIKLGPGTDPSAVLPQVQQQLGSLPGVVVRSERELAAQVSGRANSVFVLFYALLALTGLMALLGMLNALTLSIHERTRELGVLRAIGMTRRQAMALIRDESLITAAHRDARRDRAGCWPGVGSERLAVLAGDRVRGPLGAAWNGGRRRLTGRRDRQHSRPPSGPRGWTCSARSRTSRPHPSQKLECAAL